VSILDPRIIYVSPEHSIALARLHHSEPRRALKRFGWLLSRFGIVLGSPVVGEVAGRS
jgi:hypothetical protein